MKAYGLDDGSQFGWNAPYYYGMQYENYKANGKVCQSMLAVQVDSYKAECASYR